MKLDASLRTALRIYGPARMQCRRDYDSIHYADYHPVVAAKIIGLAFLSALAAWEDFLSEIFLGYMCRYRAPNGFAPVLKCGPAKNRVHAISVLTGEQNSREAERRTRWNSAHWIIGVAKIHFLGGEPFSGMSPAVIQHLDWATTIRNRAAHNSAKAKGQFKSVANQLLNRSSNSPLDRGFSPGQLLIDDAADTFPCKELVDYDDLGWNDNFQAYISLFCEESRRLVPGASIP